MSAPETASNRFGRFMERGGWWRAVLFTAVYLALYVGAGLLVETLFGDAIGDDPFGDATTLFLAMTLPLLIGSALLLAAVAALFLVRGRAETGGLMREPGLLPLGAAGSGCSPRCRSAVTRRPGRGGR